MTCVCDEYSFDLRIGSEWHSVHKQCGILLQCIQVMFEYLCATGVYFQDSSYLGLLLKADTEQRGIFPHHLAYVISLLRTGTIRCTLYRRMMPVRGVYLNSWITDDIDMHGQLLGSKLSGSIYLS